MMVLNKAKFNKIKQNVSNNIYAFLLGLILATLFFKENINSISIILYITVWVYNKEFKKLNGEEFKKIKWYLRCVSIYLTFVLIGVFFANDYLNSINYLLKQSLILFFIFLTINLKWNDERIRIVNKIFIFATFLFVLYIWGGVIYQIIKVKNIYIFDLEHPTWKYYLFTSGRLSPEVHPTYLSIYLYYCLINLIFTKKKIISNKFIYIVLLIIFSITLLLLSSRGAILSLFLVLFIYFLYKALITKSKKSFVGLFLLISLIILIFSNSSVMNRVSKLRNLYGHSIIEIANINNSSGMRTQIYLISSEVIKDNFIFGTGTKNWMEINKIYYKKYFEHLFSYNIEKLNTHNQYLNAIVSWGILGLIILILMFIQLLCLTTFSENKGNLLFWCFLFLVLLTENVLDRHRGIVFFSVISALTVAAYNKKNKNYFKK